MDRKTENVNSLNQTYLKWYFFFFFFFLSTKKLKLRNWSVENGSTKQSIIDV